MTDRAKLIARLNASFEMQYSKRGLLTGQHTADDLISYGVTFAKDTNVPSWIPLTERYPEENKRVLLWCKEDGVNIGCYTGYGPFRVRLWEPHIIPDRPTHWMPLPEPPKEDNHD